MELVAPQGPVYQAGTLSGNPLAMTAGAETLRALREPGAWDGIVRAAERLRGGLEDAAAAAGVPVQTAQAGTMLGLFFGESPVQTWEDARRSDTARFARFHRAMLERGVYLPPSQFESWFLSTKHGDDEIEATIAAAGAAFAEPAGPTRVALP
jgi:glutamate-1-semialdehyde 2,1-aminomutase